MLLWMFKVIEMYLCTHTRACALFTCVHELNERKRVFLRFAFCFDFSEVSQGNLYCCLFQNRMMYSYHSFLFVLHSWNRRRLYRFYPSFRKVYNIYFLSSGFSQFLCIKMYARTLLRINLIFPDLTLH